MLNAVARLSLRRPPLAEDDLARLNSRTTPGFTSPATQAPSSPTTIPMASWSAVYCVRPGEAVRRTPGKRRAALARPAAGGRRVSRTRPTLHLRDPFALRPLELRLAAGDAVIFPSYVFHEVTPFYGARHADHGRDAIAGLRSARRMASTQPCGARRDRSTKQDVVALRTTALLSRCSISY